MGRLINPWTIAFLVEMFVLHLLWFRRWWLTQEAKYHAERRARYQLPDRKGEV